MMGRGHRYDELVIGMYVMLSLDSSQVRWQYFHLQQELGEHATKVSRHCK